MFFCCFTLFHRISKLFQVKVNPSRNTIMESMWHYSETANVLFALGFLFFLKINESRYIALFVFSGSIKKLFAIDYVNIYLFSIFFSIDFTGWKSVGLPHVAYIVIH